MRKITANYIYSPDTGFLKFGIIEIDDRACIIEIVDTNGCIKEIQGLEFYSGLVVTGRIENPEFLKLKEQQDLRLNVLLENILATKQNEGLTILHDVDLTNFLIKSTSSVEILA